MLEWFVRHRRWIILVCVVVVLLAAIISVTRSHLISRFFLDYFRDWSVALSAGVTLVLAYIAFTSIIENRRMREEDKELAFKRRSLDGILTWAQEIRKQCLMPRPTELYEYELAQGLQTTSIQNRWVVMTAGIFGEDFQAKVDKAAKDLSAYIQALAPLAQREQDTTSRNSLMQSLNVVLEAIFKIKLDYKL